jgi:putative transposase
MFTGRPERLKTFDYVGLHRYSLTFCTQFRRRIFVESSVVELVLAQILRAADQEQFAIPAYCFMPEHVHVLAQGVADTADCRRFMKLSKQYSGYAYAQKYGNRLWQPWGYERVLRDDEATSVVARYIVENPVRAGLVASVLEYPFVGSQIYGLKDLIASLPT